MATARSRTRSRGSILGTYTGYNGAQPPSVSSRTYSLGSERCDDTVGNLFGDNGLLIIKDVRDIVGMNGTYNITPNGSSRLVCKNWPWEITSGAAAIPSGMAVPSVGPSFPTAAAMARSNPSKPTVSLPVAIAELRDLPRTYRDIVEQFHNFKRVVRPTQFGKNYITWNFGVAPLLSDVQKIVDFVGETEKVRKRLNDLYDGDGLRRSGTLDTYTGSVIQRNLSFTNTTYFSVIGDVRTMYTEKLWYSTRWKPTSRPDFGGDPGLLNLARRVAYGVNGIPSLEDVYNLIPWSWLVDYFMNIGDILGSGNNAIPATCTSCCIMRMKTITQRYNPTTPSYGGSCTKVHTTKMRSFGVSPLNNPSGFQVIGGYQASILGALALSRSKKSR